MKLKKLWIEKYQKYSNQEIIFDNTEIVSELQKQIFGNMNIVLFSGENGSGKTTILSFIAYIFRYIQRFRERLESDYILSYEIQIEGTYCDIVLKKVKSDVYIQINGNRYCIMEYKIGRDKGYCFNQYIKDVKQIEYDKIKKYLPAKVYVHAFDNAYKKLTYSSNYIGDRLVEYRDISLAYGTTSRGNFNSPGIAYLYYNFILNPQLRNLFKAFGLELSNFVDIYTKVESKNSSKNHFIYDNPWYEITGEDQEMYDKSEIIQYLEKIDSEYDLRFRIVDYLKNKKRYKVLVELIDKGIIYINEFYIRKEGKDISIQNMSTGEKAFLFDLFAICSRIKENSLIIWEEPETHLNMKWAQNLIPLLAELFSQSNVQWLLSSHSAYMIKNLFQNQIIRLNGMDIKNPDFNTFLANDTEIYKKLFEDNVINPFERKAIEYIKDGEANIRYEMMNVLGESYLKFMLFKSLEN